MTQNNDMNSQSFSNSRNNNEQSKSQTQQSQEVQDPEEELKVINQHRQIIDEIDDQIIPLLNKRAKEALIIRDLKKKAHLSLYDSAREEQIGERIAQNNEGPLYDDNLRAIYDTILRVMKEAPSA